MNGIISIIHRYTLLTCSPNVNWLFKALRSLNQTQFEFYVVFLATEYSLALLSISDILYKEAFRYFNCRLSPYRILAFLILLHRQ